VSSLTILDHLRKILDFETVNNAQPTSLRIVESFAEIASTLVPPEKTLNTVLSTWNNHYFSNDFREFLFKQRNNTLGVGARVAHFDEHEKILFTYFEPAR
jgi:hypothetical protein